ncbi:hypothetical protein B566_EDAN017957, partial [Ephemera danica]
MVSHVVSSVLLIVCVFVFSGHSQVAVPGVCQDVTLVQNFDTNIDRYLGLWYEYQRYFAFFETNGKCVTAEYGLLPNGNVSVLNTQTNNRTGEVDTISGEAYFNDPASGEANLTVVFPSAENAWLLTREWSPSSQVLEAAQVVIDSNNLADVWIITDQSTCQWT